MITFLQVTHPPRRRHAWRLFPGLLLLLHAILASAQQTGAAPQLAHSAPDAGYTWDIRCVDCPKALDELSTRS
ncbi:MAG: hypothetical protein WBF31_00035, partial [Anaerolineae bacterium]